ncbi:threonine synthase [Halogranum amylolyticum]|uniref:Threonine synthase n=1 Tax=Halogranum amylolyticum TaxID=660520 RepID=A0A1H8QW95_9EURY|nr:threonine synthase [Halogranum amylolyticum]SEO58326.1 threonine synthase [Halogranum amylolyticum]
MTPPTLSCVACGETVDEWTATRCDCGGPRWIDVDADDFGWDDVTDESGMWRYGSLLPVSSPGGLGDVAGDTPLVRTPRLDGVAGVNVHVKYEAANPTGSFKDRGSAVGVAWALDHGVDTVGTVSHGNMAMSMAAHAAGVDLDCVVLVPTDIPAERLGNIAQYDPTLVRVDGDYGKLYERSLELGAEVGVEFVNSDAPLRVEGQKTTVVEVLEAFAPDVPDAIVLPVSSGGHASGAWKAVRELRRAGAIDRVPRLYFVQATACAPIAEAFEAGADEVTPVTAGETVAYSIANANPPSGNRTLAAARETDGAVLAVDDEEILTAQRALAARAGLAVETSSATTLAGARRLAARGELTSEEDVVLVATGSGFKERGTSETPDVETVALDDLETVLGRTR